MLVGIKEPVSITGVKKGETVNIKFWEQKPMKPLKRNVACNTPVQHCKHRKINCIN
jgi:hypothetical protein